MMKSRVLLEMMIINLHRLIGTSPVRDISTLRRRLSHEGDSFMTITLPLLDDLLIEGLTAGRLPKHLGWRSDKEDLPLFLNTFWKRIFLSGGVISPTPCIHSIRAIRQISRSFKKIKENCSDDKINLAVETFVETDRSLSTVTFPKYGDALRDVAHAAFGQIVGEVSIVDAVQTAKHGPGGVADSKSSPQKWEFDTASPRLLEHFGHEFFRATWADLLGRPVTELDLPAKLVAVPKTATKPRLISIEPSATQFAQQAYAVALKESLGDVRVCQYMDARPNQLLAKAGSIDGSLATIDLSEASDRVHYGLLKWMFNWNPLFLSILDATRTRDVQLPDGRNIILNKYASMGSALNFPVETMVFTTIVLTAICAVEQRWDRRFVKSLLKRPDVRIYGDDIIVPVVYVPTVIEILESCGLKVNTNKSFWSGNFRESCGADWYDGYSVKPVYVRNWLPESQRHVDELVSLNSFRDQWLLAYGEGEVTRYIDEIMEMILHVYPHHPSPPDTQALTRRGVPSETRWNPDLQIVEFRAHVAKRVRKPTSHRDFGRLHSNLRQFDDNRTKRIHDLRAYALNISVNTHDPQKWTHDGRPTSAKLKRRWLSLT